MKEQLYQYILQLGDNSMILGQRLAEWCGHGPALEVDMALTNISLDLFGQTRSYFQYAAEVEGKGRSEDDIAFLRDTKDFKNALLVEQPNGDFAQTIARQFFFDVYHKLFLEALTASKDAQLAAIAQKSLKEVTYHVRFSNQWLLRLGDGTSISHDKMQSAIDDLWMYSGELFEMTAIDNAMLAKGIGVDLNALRPIYDKKIRTALTEATLKIPEGTWMQSGGKTGRHSEHLGYILSEMQWLQRAYPNASW